jgi:hypothetical protein
MVFSLSAVTWLERFFNVVKLFKPQRRTGIGRHAPARACRETQAEDARTIRGSRALELMPEKALIEGLQGF